MRLLEMTMSAVDLEEMRQFYCAILGLRDLEPYWTDRVAVQAGITRLNFEPAAAGLHGRYHFAFTVPANRFQVALRWLRERRGPIADKEGQTLFHSDSWNADSVYFYDTQGNILELIARHELSPEETSSTVTVEAVLPETRLPEDRPFNASEILAVSEFGISTASVVDSVASLTERMPGLEIYRGPGSDEFTAVGDPHGLLIVVRRERIWFPDTGVPAQPLPFRLLVEMENGQRYSLSAPPYPFTVSPV